ncbi:CRISPR-associated protein Csx18 [Pseudanabaena sp. PCC 6802]|uniref:CRISPR-associated protein Csx18 n=1 Tax=Pseudanabaena sp. PCC 6802 TaxID=118173 RepID=UPI000349E9B4|nr:CRISPR-associated protein Csx18 [Pseudanabaena sp. PCC 6802]
MYYLTPKAAQVRNISVSVANGTISLIILLIAPLGLLAVIVNTLLIIASTYAVTTASDRIIVYLQRDQRVELLPRSERSDLQRRDRNDLDRQ